MRLLLGSLFVFVIATIVGLGGTYLALERGAAFGSLSIGTWKSWPKSGTVDADPYARADIARSGQLPIALGDGVAFFARADDDGRPLSGRCDVVVSGMTPTSRFWTLTLYTPSGQLAANAIGRFGFTSQEVVRRADGSFSIAIGPRVTAGNWLPTGGVDRYVLYLRLYDTAVGVSTGAGREVVMPIVKTASCP
ncbi:MAG: hypothetical protein OJF62_003097 [Pseudolabrys sp.]|nr:hypothetical protein [Pseudolabrys sp.]